MEKDSNTDTERRSFLYALGGVPAVLVPGISASGTRYIDGDGEVPYTTASDPDEGQEGVTVVVNNVGVSAWEVTEAGEDVAETGVDDPEMTLTVGTRYRFENRGWMGHPFEFRDEDGNALLSQATTGEFEGDEEVAWEEGNEVFSFRVTESLSEELDSYICTAHPVMGGSVSTVEGGESGEENTDTRVEFGDQALGTTGNEQSGVFGMVRAEGGSLVLVTYEEETEDGSETVVASAGELEESVEGATVGISVEEGGFPGEHTMHIIEDASEEFSPGDTVSEESLSNVIAQDTGTVFGVELGFENQSFVGSTNEVTVDTGSLFDGQGDETPFVVGLYPTNEDNELTEDELVGSSEVVSGENRNLSISLQTERGEPLEIDETDDYVAGIGLASEEAEVGDSFSPEDFQALGVLSQGEPSVVTEKATVTVEQREEETETQNNETEEGNTTSQDSGGDSEQQEQEQEGLPGFGVIGGVVALLGAGTARMLRSQEDE